ncbi:MAG: succinate dehydrogenase, hydrophobic membrane anchor protein [Pseudomonadota bacterium]|nr:succinate dehydrogenase, hydrophobic membrane anchor protein [Pseudomonadota bacterium]
MRIVLTGLRAWLVQRASAIYLLLFILFFIGHFLFDPPRDFGAWRDWVAQPWIGVAILSAFVALLLHAWVGLRDVMLDYIHPVGLRAPALALLGATLIAIGLWMLRLLAGGP